MTQQLVKDVHADLMNMTAEVFSRFPDLRAADCDDVRQQAEMSIMSAICNSADADGKLVAELADPTARRKYLMKVLSNAACRFLADRNKTRQRLMAFGAATCFSSRPSATEPTPSDIEDALRIVDRVRRRLKVQGKAAFALRILVNNRTVRSLHDRRRFSAGLRDLRRIVMGVLKKEYEDQALAAFLEAVTLLRGVVFQGAMSEAGGRTLQSIVVATCTEYRLRKGDLAYRRVLNYLDDDARQLIFAFEQGVPANTMVDQMAATMCESRWGPAWNGLVMPKERMAAQTRFVSLLRVIRRAFYMDESRGS